MINGVHVIVYSRDDAADRAFIRDVLGFAHVDAGGGWLIFKTPPGEVAVHPSEGPQHHELYLLCDDIEATYADLTTSGVEVEGEISDQGWGRLITLRLPGGGALGVYEPRHPVAAGS